jgi:multidrug efflux pump subunit AcrA (membrane-fusion protein)
MHKRWIIILVAAMTLMGLVGCKSTSTPTPTPIATAAPSSSGPGFGGDIVVASATVVPALVADVSFTLVGRVKNLPVVKGDIVEPGQVLVTLETETLQAKVKQAQTTVAAAEAHLALLKAGPRPEEIAVAQAQVAVAEAALAQSAVQRNQPDLGAAEGELAAAQARVSATTTDRMIAEEYHNKTLTCVTVKLPGGKKKTVCPALGAVEEQARYNWHATQAAEAAAQTELDALQSGGNAEVRAAQAGVQVASAHRDIAQAQLDVLQAGATADEIGVAEAAVEQARAALQAAQVALDQATLRAPFAAKIAAVEVCPGEAVMPGQVVVKLADLDHLRIETTDLSERDVSEVEVGQRARVYVKPLDTEVSGQVVHIASQATTIGGDVVYAVTVALDEQSEGLRWGMSAEVGIDTLRE